jgi:hypothetical protein
VKLSFIEFPAFTRRLLEITDDEALRELQNDLMKQPDKGDVIQGSGGFRKVRMKIVGRGKSGGARVIYLRVPEVAIIVFVMIYTKGNKTNLTAKERITLREIATEIKKELL